MLLFKILFLLFALVVGCKVAHKTSKVTSASTGAKKVAFTIGQYFWPILCLLSLLSMVLAPTQFWFYLLLGSYLVIFCVAVCSHLSGWTFGTHQWITNSCNTIGQFAIRLTWLVVIPPAIILSWRYWSYAHGFTDVPWIYVSFWVFLPLATAGVILLGRYNQQAGLWLAYWLAIYFKHGFRFWSRSNGVMVNYGLLAVLCWFLFLSQGGPDFNEQLWFNRGRNAAATTAETVVESPPAQGLSQVYNFLVRGERIPAVERALGNQAVEATPVELDLGRAETDLPGSFPKSIWPLVLAVICSGLFLVSVVFGFRDEVWGAISAPFRKKEQETTVGSSASKSTEPASSTATGEPESKGSMFAREAGTEFLAEGAWDIVKNSIPKLINQLRRLFTSAR